ncbi:MAG: ABC transporter ATP-binding protein [Actinomycetota bacterium]
MASGWRGVWKLTAFAFRVDPIRSVAVLIFTVIEYAAAALIALWLKLLVDGITTGRDDLIYAGGAGMVGISIILREICNWAHFPLRETMRERTALEMDAHLMELSGRIPTLAHHESSTYLREMERLRGESHRLANAVGNFTWNFGMMTRLAVTLALLATLDIALIAMPVCALPAVIISARIAKHRQATRDATAERERTAGTILWLATESAPAKELRVFGLAPTLLQMYRDLRASTTRDHDANNRRATLLIGSGWLIFALGYIGAIALVVSHALDGRATTGDVVLAMNLASQVSQEVSGLASIVQWLQEYLLIAKRYLWLVDLSGSSRKTSRSDVPIPERLTDGIRFDDVSFAYPGTEEAVLKDVTLHFPAGSTVAVVGDNGAGKTTLVKLLMRFYEPTAGRVTVDGIDLADLEPNVWLAQTSAGFQDFVQFELIAQETVGVGQLETVDDESAVHGALDRANATDVIEALPNGLSSQLGRRFEDGAQLSIGQWQKLALGRSMMRETPVLLVLDEPTAALDPMTEHALFERYVDASRRIADVRRSITLLVSHRFSTVRMADVIVVIDSGRVTEFGSHSELMALGGTYAELFEIQASAYR